MTIQEFENELQSVIFSDKLEVSALPDEPLLAHVREIASEIILPLIHVRPPKWFGIFIVESGIEVVAQYVLPMPNGRRYVFAFHNDNVTTTSAHCIIRTI